MPLKNLEIQAANKDELYDLFAIVEEQAEQVDCSVYRPGESELLIDLDSEEQYKLFLSRLDLFSQLNSHLSTMHKELPSKSGLPHRHLLVTLFAYEEDSWGKNPYKIQSEWERICLQFFFGSDFNRESLNTLRLVYNEGIDSGNCFFQPLEKK